MTVRSWTDRVSSVFQYYDNDDDAEPTLVDSAGIEYGYCAMCEALIPLPDIRCERCDGD